MCMTLRGEIRRATFLPAFRSVNFRMNGYAPYAALAKKSFLLINRKLTLKETLENIYLVDCHLLFLYLRPQAGLVS